METITFNVPEWTLPAFVNGDFSGLYDDEVTMVEDIIKVLENEYGEISFSSGDDLGFCLMNDFNNEAGNCCELIVLIS